MAKTELHDIRLVAGFELAAPGLTGRVLERDQAAELADALAADLVRAVPDADQAMLVVAGSLLEPNEVLRPGLPAWASLSDLAGPILRDQGTSGQVLAIGSHDQRLPDRRLAPPDQAPAGRFVVLPLLLIAPLDQAADLEQAVEQELFERGHIAPPARALLDRQLGLQSTHGQLLTLTDLLALQHVQMDAAGLAGFWPAVEHAILRPDTDQRLALPGGLSANWNAAERCLKVCFLNFDQFGQAADHYLLWQRAFRTLIALAESHGLHWTADISDGELTEQQDVLIHSAGPCRSENSLTEQSDPDVGLIAWTLVEDGSLSHHYPLSPAAGRRHRSALEARFPTVRRPGCLCYCPESFTLKPAPAP